MIRKIEKSVSELIQDIAQCEIARKLKFCGVFKVENSFPDF